MERGKLEFSIIINISHITLKQPFLTWCPMVRG